MLAAPSTGSGPGKGPAQSGDPATWYIPAHNSSGPGATAKEAAGSISFQTLKAVRQCAAKARLEHWKAAAAPGGQQEHAGQEGREHAKALTPFVFVDAVRLGPPGSEQPRLVEPAGVPGTERSAADEAGAGLRGGTHLASTAEPPQPGIGTGVAGTGAMGRVESTFLPAPTATGKVQAGQAAGNGRAKPSKQATPASDSDSAQDPPKPPSRASRPEHDLAVHTAIEVCSPGCKGEEACGWRAGGQALHILQQPALAHGQLHGSPPPH